MKVTWSPEAVQTFDGIMEYLETEVSQKQMDTFYFKCNDVIDLIKVNPYLYQSSKKNNIRKAVIHKYTTLYFEISLLNNSIVLLSFFDTRQNPNKKTFL